MAAGRQGNVSKPHGRKARNRYAACADGRQHLIMKKYYFVKGKSSFGPYTLEEMRIHKLENGTLIWHEGLPDWRPMSELPELSMHDLVNSFPPPIPGVKQTVTDAVSNDPDDFKTNTREKIYLQVIGMSLLALFFLITLYYLNNLIYQYLINRGGGFGASIYDNPSGTSNNDIDNGYFVQIRNIIHASASKPWVFGIFGFFIFFGFIRQLLLKHKRKSLEFSIVFAAVYFILELVFELVCGKSWSNFGSSFLVSNGATLVGGVLAFLIYRPSMQRESSSEK